jgi:hypothetical protein
MGGMFSASALYPLEILKTRMQAEGDAEEVLPNTQDGEGKENVSH